MQSILGQRLLTLRIIFGVFMLQPFVLGFIVLQGGASYELDPSVFISNPMVLIFLAVSGAAFFGGFFVKKLMLSATSLKKSLQDKMDQETLSSQMVEGKRVYSDEEIEKILSLSPKHQAMLKIHPSFFVACIVSFVLFEMPTILGMIVGFQTSSLLAYLPFMMLTLVGLALNAPTMNRWEDVLKLVPTSDWA